MANDENRITKPQIFVEELDVKDGKKIPISRGDIVVFVGSNNVGKTQILKDIQSSILKGYGSVVLNGVKTNREGNISYIMQNSKEINRDKHKYIIYSGVEFDKSDFISDWHNQ